MLRLVSGDSQTKRELLAAVGWNLILKGRKLSIQALKPFLILENALHDEIMESESMEPENSGSPHGQKETDVSSCPVWGHDRYAFMTVLCDHEYLCGIREKIRLIQQFQRDEKVATV